MVEGTDNSSATFSSFEGVERDECLTYRVLTRVEFNSVGVNNWEQGRQVRNCGGGSLEYLTTSFRVSLFPSISFTCVKFLCYVINDLVIHTTLKNNM